MNVLIRQCNVRYSSPYAIVHIMLIHQFFSRVHEDAKEKETEITNKGGRCKCL